MSSACFSSFTNDDYVRLYKLSKQHDIAHIVGDALINNGIALDTEIKQKFEKQILSAVYRCENQSAELIRVCKAFDSAEIPYLPLKGSVIRSMYPTPWLRTSTDIDILVRSSDISRASAILTSELGLTKNADGDHDIHFTSPSGVALELHFRMIECDVIDRATEVLSDVWSYATNSGGSRYDLSNEMLCYYHIAHMAKHFVNGGCGIRPFIDLYYLDSLPVDKAKLDSLYTSGGLGNFAVAAVRLKNAWLCGGGYDELTTQMERYLLLGGAFGTRDNYVAASQSKRGGKLGYLLSRIWRPYEVLKDKYPALNGKKALLPYYEVKRWFELLSIKGKAKQSISEIKANGSTSDDSVKAIGEMLTKLGI